MKKLLLLLLLSLSFLSCVPEEEEEDEGASLTGLLNVYKADLGDFNAGGVDLSQVTISFAASIEGAPEGVLGACFPDTNEIVIIESFWQNASALEQKVVLYHELGHCQLNRPHRGGVINGNPISIMYPTLLPIETYAKYEEAYLQELFTRDTGEIVASLQADEENNNTADADDVGRQLAETANADLPHGFCWNEHKDFQH